MKDADTNLDSLIPSVSLKLKRIGPQPINGTQDQIKTSPRSFTVTVWLLSQTTPTQFICKTFKTRPSIESFSLHFLYT